MNLRARVQRLTSQQQDGLNRLEVWMQDETGDTYTCSEQPGERMTLQQLEARDDPGLAQIIISRYEPSPGDAA